MGKVFLVPTPIGNLKDITFRAVEVLKNVSLILAEDTRVSSKLLSHYGIETPLRSYHQHNEKQKTNFVVEAAKNGDVALITDAGTPGISDPGFFLVRACRAEGIEVECLPGATAMVPALVQSGLACERFSFEGFLPHQKGRAARLKELSFCGKTMVFYESPHRLCKTLEQFVEFFGAERRACVCREISKMYAEDRCGSLAELLEYFEAQAAIKGEFVIVVEGCEDAVFSYRYPRAALTVDVIVWRRGGGGARAGAACEGGRAAANGELDAEAAAGGDEEAKCESAAEAGATTSATGEVEVLLIKRKNEPFENFWALPGGFVGEYETLEWAARRELKEETGIKAKAERLGFLKAYSALDRDPRERVVSMVYSANFEDCEGEAIAADDACEANWFSLKDALKLQNLAFDHREILNDFSLDLEM